jgi:GT2 family glycosyltransferase
VSRPDLTQTSAAAPRGARRRERRPDVTVCIVNWNCRDYLRACLRSLRPRRQGVRVRVVVVDNGSTDGAADLVAREFPRVTLVRNGWNAGFARANNQAAARARGRYLFFLNNDTLVPPLALKRLLDFAEANPQVGMIGPRLRDGRGRTQLSCRRRPTLGALLHRLALLRWTGLFRRAYRRYRGRDGDLAATRPVEVLMGAALFVRRSTFRACGGWDEGYTFGGEDIDLCTRISRRHAVVYHPAVTVTHFGRAASRRHIGYAHAHTVVGITRCLRRGGCPRPALWAYKAALTLDAPLQWLCHAAEYLWRRARGQRDRAEKSRRALRGLTYLLTRGLGPLWRA